MTSLLLAALPPDSSGRTAPPPAAAAPAARSYPLDSPAGLELINVKAEAATYRGRRAVRLLDQSAKPGSDHGYAMAVLPRTEFADGTLELDVAGLARTGAPETARGFIGIAFRVRDHGAAFECFYIRPLNGRAGDQLRRNHSTQYIASPGYPWERLRRDSPGVYESYVDLEPGAWTHLKVTVAGTTARLYVHGADQPALIVDDLKLGATHGQLALWVGDDTDGYFSGLTVR